MAWVESQIKKDQHEAVNPNFRTAFRSTEDACKRLLRYHVFDELDISPWDMEKADENFEIKSAVMISRLVLGTCTCFICKCSKIFEIFLKD